MSTNQFKLLRDLLPDAPLHVGTVLSVSGGVAIVELPGGGKEQARGSPTVGDLVFCRDGLIEGLAPSLTVEVITV